MLLLIGLALVLWFTPAIARSEGTGPRVAVHLSLLRQGVLSAEATVAPARGFTHGLIQVRRGGRWVAVHSAVPIRKGGRFFVRWSIGRRKTSVTVRAIALGSGGRRLIGRVATLRIGMRGASSYSVPPTTRVYAGTAVRSAKAGPSGQTIVQLAPGSAKPVVGGHAALGPSASLPYGMFAAVAGVSRSGGGGWTVTLTRAPIDQVLENVSLHLDEDVSPQVTDSLGRPLVPVGDKGAVRIAGPASFAHASSFGSVFTCKTSGRSTSADSAFVSTKPMPLSIELTHLHAIDAFDTGSVFQHRDPFFLMQVSGEAQATVGFEAKKSFACQLSDSFRETHRIAIPLGAVGPVPVTMYLEPTFKFEVSASGTVSLSQHHYWGITLEQNGFSPFKARLSHSADPVDFHASAAIGASLFAGGDLSVMFGAGEGPYALEAGIYGAFGPKFELKTSTDRPGCITATGKLEADLGVRLQVLVKRWSAQLASLSTSPANLGGPWCIGSGPGGGGGSPGGSTGGGGSDGGGGGGPTPPGGGGDTGSWTPSPAPMPTGAGAGEPNLRSAACGSAGPCFAVGGYQDAAGHEQALIEVESGSGWTAVSAPLPANASGTLSYLSSAACSTTGTCIAVGRYQDAGGREQGLIETLSGDTWTPLQAPLPPHSTEREFSYLISVGCATTCVAVGMYPDVDGSYQALIETLAAGVWNPMKAPLPANASSGSSYPYLLSVACTVAGDSCASVGSYEDTEGHHQGLIERRSSGVWEGTEAPLPGDAAVGVGAGAELGSTSCTTEDSCFVVGSYSADAHGTDQGLLETPSGHTWTPSQAPVPTSEVITGVFLRSVACSPAGDCVAVGSYKTSAGGSIHFDLIETFSDGTWTPLQPPLPSGDENAFSWLESTACWAGNKCAAVGYYQDDEGLGQGLIETLSGGTWEPATAPLPSGARSGSLKWIACTTEGRCAAIGAYEDEVGTIHSLLEAR